MVLNSELIEKASQGDYEAGKKLSNDSLWFDYDFHYKLFVCLAYLKGEARLKVKMAGQHSDLVIQVYLDLLIGGKQMIGGLFRWSPGYELYLSRAYSIKDSYASSIGYEGKYQEIIDSLIEKAEIVKC